MIILKSEAEIRKMSVACRIVAEILEELRTFIAADITTADIERFVDEALRKRGATAAFRGYRGYPSSVCVSVNDQVIHGIPSKSARIKSGDIVSVDLGAVKDGFFGDSAITVPVGSITAEAAKLIEVTEKALYLGIAQAVAGNRIGDIASAIQRHVEANGFSVVRAFVGHGIGSSLHEDPAVPNFGRPGQGPRLKEGMTLAIEPMVNAGSFEVRVLEDDWTAVTVDGALSAHFEHTVLVAKNGPNILTK